MRFIEYPVPVNLPKRWAVIYAAREAGLSGETTMALRSAYLKRYASWKHLKNWLSKLSGRKCWYCETKSARSPFDVDHFRPKLGVTVDGQKLSGGFGYYWIAYAWNNFRLSCQRCNRPENDNRGILRGKHNEFPLQDENARCQGPNGDLADETPRLLDPCVEGDCELLAHGLDGEVKPAASPTTWDHVRASYTIDLLGLNEWNLPEEKRRRWQALSLLIDHTPNPSQAVKDVIAAYLRYDQEYSSFFRSAIGTYRDKQWVEDLL